jgi:hypothetical protein
MKNFITNKSIRVNGMIKWTIKLCMCVRIEYLDDNSISVGQLHTLNMMISGGFLVH